MAETACPMTRSTYDRPLTLRSGYERSDCLLRRDSILDAVDTIIIIIDSNYVGLSTGNFIVLKMGFLLSMRFLM